MEYLGNLINLNYVKYDNNLIYLNINNVTNKVHLRAIIELKNGNEGETLPGSWNDSQKYNI